MGGCNCSVVPPGYGPGFNEQHPQPYLQLGGKRPNCPLGHIHSLCIVHFYPLLLVSFIICPLVIRLLSIFVYIFSTFLVSVKFSVKFQPTFCAMSIFCSFFLFPIHFCPLFVKYLSIFHPFHSRCPFLSTLFCLFYIHFVSTFCPVLQVLFC